MVCGGCGGGARGCLSQTEEPFSLDTPPPLSHTRVCMPLCNRTPPIQLPKLGVTLAKMRVQLGKSTLRTWKRSPSQSWPSIAPFQPKHTLPHPQKQIQKCIRRFAEKHICRKMNASITSDTSCYRSPRSPWLIITMRPIL